MHTEITRVQSIPQADGDSQPLGEYIRQRQVSTGDGPVRIHRISGPAFADRDPFVLTIQQRDAKLAHLVPAMMQLLFAAMKAHALGVVDAVTIEELPERQRKQLEADAWGAINRQSGLYRSEAERQASNLLTQTLRDLAFHFPYHNPVASPELMTIRQEVIDDVSRTLTGQRVQDLILSEAERCYSQPLSSSPRSQVVRTAMAGGR